MSDNVLRSGGGSTAGVDRPLTKDEMNRQQVLARQRPAPEWNEDAQVLTVRQYVESLTDGDLEVTKTSDGRVRAGFDGMMTGWSMTVEEAEALCRGLRSILS